MTRVPRRTRAGWPALWHAAALGGIPETLPPDRVPVVSGPGADIVEFEVTARIDHPEVQPGAARQEVPLEKE